MEISKTLPQQFFSLLDHHGFQCLPYCHKCHHRISFLKWGWRCRNTHRQHHLQHHHLEAGSVLSSASEKIQVLSHTCDLEFSGCRAQKSFIFNGTSVQHLESSGMKRLCWCDPCFWRWWANGSSQNSFGLVKSLDFKKPYRITHKLIFTWKVRFAWILGY